MCSGDEPPHGVRSEHAVVGEARRQQDVLDEGPRRTAQPVVPAVAVTVEAMLDGVEQASPRARHAPSPSPPDRGSRRRGVTHARDPERAQRLRADRQRETGERPGHGRHARVEARDEADAGEVVDALRRRAGEHRLDPATREQGGARLDPQVGDHEAGLAEALALLHDVQVLPVDGGSAAGGCEDAPALALSGGSELCAVDEEIGDAAHGQAELHDPGREEALELACRRRGPRPSPEQASGSRQK